eukprot:GHVN01041136.1.p1 GENE.GHVN01041136.1~~GHVN01041136.1.p1  ORF type:complete len:430 (-),score=98.70 GHVN01041136.1:229-1443(-)
MEARIDSNEYPDFAAFDADLQLVFSNCQRYNASETLYAKAALKLEGWWSKAHPQYSQRADNLLWGSNNIPLDNFDNSKLGEADEDEAHHTDSPHSHASTASHASLSQGNQLSQVTRGTLPVPRRVLGPSPGSMGGAHDSLTSSSCRSPSSQSVGYGRGGDSLHMMDGDGAHLNLGGGTGSTPSVASSLSRSIKQLKRLGGEGGDELPGDCTGTHHNYFNFQTASQIPAASTTTSLTSTNSLNSSVSPSHQTGRSLAERGGYASSLSSLSNTSRKREALRLMSSSGRGKAVRRSDVSWVIGGGGEHRLADANHPSLSETLCNGGTPGGLTVVRRVIQPYAGQPNQPFYNLAVQLASAFPLRFPKVWGDDDEVSKAIIVLKSSQSEEASREAFAGKNLFITDMTSS